MVAVVTTVLWQLVLQVGVATVNVVDLGLLGNSVGWILGDDVPRMNQAREVAEEEKKDVDKGVFGTHTSSNPHRKWRK